MTGEGYPNIIKVICDNPTANIIVNGEKLKAFPIREGIRQGYPIPLPLLNTVLEVVLKRQRNQR